MSRRSTFLGLSIPRLGIENASPQVLVNKTMGEVFLDNEKLDE